MEFMVKKVTKIFLSINITWGMWCNWIWQYFLDVLKQHGVTRNQILPIESDSHKNGMQFHLMQKTFPSNE